MRLNTAFLSRAFWIASLAWLAAAHGCDDNNYYTSSFDPSELGCSDGVDNDDDGFVDLVDPMR
jgi:hypothetical protein